MKPLSTLGDLMETTVRTGMTRTTIPSNPGTGSCYIEGCLSPGAMIMSWLNSSDTEVLRQVKDVVANGAIQLVFSGAVLLRPSEDHGLLDNMFDILTLYAPYVEVFPSLFERVSTLLRPMYPSSLKWQSTGRFPNSKREHSFAGDIDCLEKMAYFADKEHRVHLCDNLKVRDLLWAATSRTDDILSARSWER